MKIRNGFVSNSSTTSFILKYKIDDPDDFQKRLLIFLRVGMALDLVDDLWENKILSDDFEIYNEDGKTIIECYQIPWDIEHLIKALVEVESEETR